MRVLGIFLAGLAGCSSTIESSQAPDGIYSFPVPVGTLASCTFERLDKAGGCSDLRISNYEASGEARVFCQDTRVSTKFYSIEFLPEGEGSVVKFFGMKTLPGVASFESKILPTVRSCAGEVGI